MKASTAPSLARGRVPDIAGVGTALLAYAAELAASGAAQIGDAFTDDAAADALVKSSPNAFLLGTLFTQGIPAERAWAGPWLLRERLGHLDLSRLATEREAVVAAVGTPPCLHRFRVTMAGWISDAAERLLADWDGDASNIWTPGSHVLDVSERLSAFKGIGRKKAAVTVELLLRHFGVPLVGEESGRIAYDVHVRRVFLRAGLVDADDDTAIQAAAAAASPDAPGRLDLPTWLVGRDWCRPLAPDCEACVLSDVCARRTWVQVDGPGARPRKGAGR